MKLTIEVEVSDYLDDDRERRIAFPPGVTSRGYQQTVHLSDDQLRALGADLPAKIVVELPLDVAQFWSDRSQGARPHTPRAILAEACAEAIG